MAIGYCRFYSHRFVALLYMGLALVGTILTLLWFMRVNGSDLAVYIVLPLLCLGLWVFVLYKEHRQMLRSI